MKFYYGVDLGEVILGDCLAPSLVFALINRLPDNSLFYAEKAGGLEHFGWGVDRHILADIFDAMTENTRATGNWAKGKTPKAVRWPRPSREQAQKKNKPTTVKELYMGIKEIFH